MAKVKDLKGQRFGRLTVIEQHGFTKPNKFGDRQAVWYCKCDCGNYCEMSSGTLNCTWIPMREQYKNKQSNAVTRTV